MSEKNIEQKIKTAVESITPDVKAEILSQCNSNTGKVMKMEQKKNRKLLKSIIGAAAAIALVLVGAFGYALIDGNNPSGTAPIKSGGYYASVTLDVNPSIYFEVNSENKISKVTALNDEAKEVLENLDFIGADIKVAANAVIGSMVRHGYINELANSILVSVEGDKADKAAVESLEAEISALIKNALHSDKFDGAVLSQVVNSDGDLSNKAAEYGITKGKAQLIKEIIAADSRYSFEQLAGLSINELNLISASGKDVSGSVGAEGTASDKKYIGRDKAKEIALNHAGVKESEISRYECKMDYENGQMVYEIEFHIGKVEYEYDIGAIDGAVVKSHKDADLDDGDEKVPSSGSYISREEAKAKALAHAGLTESQVKELEIELDSEDGRVVYQVEFKAGGFEYDYELDPQSGNVLHFEKERDD